MTEILTSAQMRAIEAAAIASGHVTGLELMERAGQGVVEAVFAEWPALAVAPHRAVVLCGPGNNGGDGFVVARLLKGWGWEVEVFLYGDPGKLPPNARVNYERWCGMGEVGSDYDRPGGWECDLLVDALFGIGLRGPLRQFGNLFWNMEDMVECFPVEPHHKIGRPAIVAIDIPSGICADSGRDFPHEDEHYRFAATAHLTVTFHRAKLGHYLGDGPWACGKLVVKSIGLADHQWRREEQASIARLTGPDYLSGLGKGADSHKYHHGHALILSGGVGRGGAARLAARGALRIGAGLVTVACPASALIENAARLDAIMLRPLRGETEAGALAALLEDIRINALCLGPGLGVERARELVPVALRARRATVLDADALTAFADAPEDLFALLHAGCVLTPHDGEFARLFPDIAAKVAAPATTGPAYSKVDATREAAARAGCTVLLKGPDTVIAAPSGRAVLNAAVYERSAPWLATAGAGDVLAGILTGLLARGLEPFSAASTAAWLHVEAARNFGPGLIAEDLPERLPAVLKSLT
ncbi:NAD(P)H-hydrate dehydratase [Frigidibacter sp.]|uniref:NAD(P)H-hydrate dehydratase n=1 Tax=Frigidibacter sp. TaxID=2586418 RepID=UPI00273341B7|nr:NAD(P)H-hydrate dehydratase [Frigidibacter sp.]MDP3339638.1 NAD(P)H-hydrate dehydratase [Frigidibacter sp.]